MPRKHRRSLKDYLLPHRGNSYKPVLFTAGSIAVVVLGLLLVQAAYVLQTSVVFTQTNFLASVLPGVLATLSNEDRAQNGIASLEPDPLLAKAAQMKANDMAAKGYFAHVDPDGNAPWYWLEKAGYEYSYAGENLAVNFTDSEDVEEAWMNSPTHRANIVKPQYSRVGFGIAQGTYQGKDTTFVVQFFATPKAAAALPKSPIAVVAADPAPEATVPPATALKPVPGAVLAVESQVLGIDTAPEESVSDINIQPAASVLAKIATSPTHAVIYILGALILIFAILLIIAIVSHAKVQYLEVIGGGLLVILVATALLVYNATSISEVEVPETDGNTAVEVRS